MRVIPEEYQQVTETLMEKYPEAPKLTLLKPKKGDLPQRAQRKFEIKQEDKLLFSALLCALVK